ncbi:MAG: DGQHR domain-containing protein DpdB [Aridibacter sp.]
MKSKKSAVLRRRALKIYQDEEHPLFLFSLTGKELLQIAEISRVSRDDDGKLIGYQRPEVKQHIQNIIEYLNSKKVIFPNSIILALSSEIAFKESRGPKVDEGFAVSGTIEIPVPQKGELKPAWIVDGQQRTMALANSKRLDFPVPINAFIADGVELQRDQFLRINSTKPLPKGLIDELLPEVDTLLPANLTARKVPSALCDMLNQELNSPFYGLIRRASTTNQRQGTEVIADTVITQMLQESLKVSGSLSPYRNAATGNTDFDGVRSSLFIYWNAVRETFPEAWGLKPEKSRLMHGAGIKSMGRLMDRVMAMIDVSQPETPLLVRNELEKMKPFCHWTSGVWEDIGGIKWNEIQNLPNHIKLLSNYLIRTYINSRKINE